MDLERLSVEIAADASSAVSALDKLSVSLRNVASSSNLTKTINQLTKLKTALSGFDRLGGSIGALRNVGSAVQSLGQLSKLTSLNSAMNTLSKMPAVFSAITPALESFSKVNLAPALARLDSLAQIQKLTGLNSVANSLNKMGTALRNLDMGEFSTDMQKLATAITPLVTQVERLSKAYLTLPAAFRRSIAPIRQSGTAAQTAKTQFTGLGIAVSNTALNYTALFYIVQRVSNFLGGAIRSYAGFVENVNLFNVSMGEYAEEGAEFAQKMQDLLGIDMSGALRNMGILQNLVTSFGVASDQAYILSKNMTQLAYDFSSFFDLNIDDSFQKIQAAISGELEPIRRLGVDISEARLDQELVQIGDLEIDLGDAALQAVLFSQGIDLSVDSLNQADKSLLRYIAIMEQTANAQGDLGRTINDPMNQLRIFNQQIDLLVRSIGSLLIPMLNALLPPLIAVTQITREWLSAIAAAMGVTVQFGDADKYISSAGSSMSGALDGVADSAADAAEQIAYLVGGFDELNVLPSASSTSGLGGDSAGSLLGGIELPEYDIFKDFVDTEASKWVEKLREPMETILDLAWKIGAAFLLWKIGSAIFTGVAALTKALGPGSPLQTGVSSFGAAFSKLGPTTFTSAAAGAGLLAAAIGLSAVYFVDLYNTSESFRDGLTLIGELAGAMWDGFALKAAQEFQPVFDKLGDMGLGFSDVSQAVKDFGIIALGVAAMFLPIPGSRIIGAILIGTGAAGLAIQQLGLITDDQAERMKSAFAGIGAWVSDFLIKPAAALAMAWVSAFDSILLFAEFDFKGGLLAVFNAITYAVEGLINLLTFGLLGDAMGGITDKLRSWASGGSYSGGSGGGSYSVPALASGGVLYGPQVVLAGEYAGASSNPEIVAPQSILRDTVSEIVFASTSPVVAAINRLNTTLTEKEMSVEITDKEVGESAARYGQQQKRRTGKSPY